MFVNHILMIDCILWLFMESNTQIVTATMTQNVKLKWNMINHRFQLCVTLKDLIIVFSLSLVPEISPVALHGMILPFPWYTYD